MDHRSSGNGLPTSSRSKQQREEPTREKKRDESTHDGRSRRGRGYQDEANGSLTRHGADSSDHPARDLGSAKRRAQRAGADTQGSGWNNFSQNHGHESRYKQPYVEDSSSRLTTTSLSTVPNSPRDDVDREQKWASKRKQRKEKNVGQGSPHTPPSRISLAEDTHDADASVPSSLNSSRSSSGKSVKFNPSVGVRQPSRRANSDHSSDSDVEDAPIKPDDNSKPSRAGKYGDNPFTGLHSQPLSPPERLYHGNYRHESGSVPRLWDFSTPPTAPPTGPGSGRGCAPGQEPTSKKSKGAFSGMSSFGSDDWKAFADASSANDADTGGEWSANATPQDPHAYDGQHETPGKNWHRDAQSSYSPTQVPDQPSSRSGHSSPNDRCSPKTADNH